MAETSYLNPTARRASSGSEWALPIPVGPTNVGDVERWASGVGGAILMVRGLTRGSLGGLALATIGGSLLYRGVTGYCGMYQVLGVDTSDGAGQGPSSSIPARQGVKVQKSVTINRPVEELYRFWRDFENLPRVMRHLKSVKVADGNRSHWVAEGPMGAVAEWDAEIHNERENELIAWRSVEGSPVDTAGSVRFVRAPGNKGTEVHVTLKYNPPGGQLGIALAKILGRDAETQVREDLRRFKQVMEAGEIPTIAGQPTGQRSAKSALLPWA